MTQTMINNLSYDFDDKSIYSIECDLIDILKRKALEHPDHHAIITEERVINYRDLIHQSQSLASHLYNIGIKRETPVAILLEPGIEQIISQIAILMVGGSCVPLDPAMPDSRLCFMLQDLKINLTLTTHQYQERVLPTGFVIIHENILKNPRTKDLPNIHRCKSHRSHVLFTSGTTGTPKAVELEARGILRIVVNPTYINLTATDKIASICNPTFDVYLFEIWGALLNGASIVVIPRKIIIDPYQFEAILEKFSINILIITASLFHLIAHTCPQAFGHLRYLLIGGEALNPHALRQVLQSAPPKHLINCYGPTESTIMSLIHEITLDELTEESVPIGKPIANTDIYILDENQQSVAPNQIGEMYLGGEGLARGYWNRSEINAQRFIMADVGENNQLERIYKTGDLGLQRSDGVYMYSGRVDNQIKIRGHRIEIEEVEIQLIRSKLLQSAAVCIIKKENIEPYLIAFIVPREPATFSKQTLIKWINDYLPEYMRPRLSIVENIPLTLNGKMDKSRLLTEYSQKREQRLLSQSNAEMSAEELILLNIWREILDDEEITLDNNFFESGGNSLQAARLIIEIENKMQQRLPIQLLYDSPTPRELVASLQQEKSLSDDICTIMLKDCELPPDIQPLSQSPKPWLNSNSGRVLLTGATGFLGAFFLRDLLLQTEINKVICLVRSHDDESALLRIKENLNKYGLWKEEFLPRLQVIASDLGKPQFALNPEIYDQLSTECDVIFHLAAHINYTQPYSMHYSGNILGTLNILRFAVSKKIKPLHYVSTISVFGPAGLLSSVSRIDEDDDITSYLDNLKYDSGYSQSQWVVEQIIWQAKDRGIPLAVYRPGFIMGDSLTGAGNHNDFVSRLTKGCIAMGAYPLLENQREEFVPVDYVSQALLNISCDNCNLGKSYHLVSPDSKQSIDLNTFFSLFNQCGYHLKGMRYSEWLKELETNQNLTDNPLTPLLPMLSEKIYRELTRWEVYKNMPAYDAKNTESALQETPITYTPMDSDLLERYLAYWKHIGFLP
ncbi:putative Nonribosomal peptide synthase (NRPS) [Xenorhabdus nematophila ATCC 19061]|uniref:Nonribosomal peptide synthase (NRPS) n=1 Tax=Xenorhabdus nematophila (strain ATCC 19061 / DSM 3370 / CCUG 14189 / LMG 1036 / NCIMB 9965 / AN6) TaxID=406817 RepID=D3VBI5_XENNA|nr:non-ribosomal peptide synthetase [Xenorhabdus nematophila]CBJ89624.1 putative Nonribosomal peptide synthase (NRPS) [Xenorhabdus nematophila ATCC 19061]CEK22512.1 putative Nonribosomal peptide synthase (NRPS) [Xenorhabdus nematophila AN6/1]